MVTSASKVNARRLPPPERHCTCFKYIYACATINLMTQGHGALRYILLDGSNMLACGQIWVRAIAYTRDAGLQLVQYSGPYMGIYRIYIHSRTQLACQCPYICIPQGMCKYVLALHNLCIRVCMVCMHIYRHKYIALWFNVS